MKKVTLPSKKLSTLIAAFASDKKAQDILILDMRKVVYYCDYFVICSGESTTHVHAIANYIEQKLSEKNVILSHKEGIKKSIWIVLDLGDIVVHIFEKEIRQFYQLEYLWQGAKKVVWKM